MREGSIPARMPERGGMVGVVPGVPPLQLERLDRSRSHHILSQEEIAEGRSTCWLELEITGTIKNLSPSLWKLQHLTALYLNDNSLFRIPSSISLLGKLRRLDLSNNKLRSLPAEIGDLTDLRELMLNNNYLRALPYELGKLFQLNTLGLKGNPLGSDVLQLFSEVNGTRKLLDFMLDNLAVSSSHPPSRPWIQLAPLDRSCPTALFTVMCYNVLCDRYATRGLYGYCPQWALNWEYRKKGILDEVRHYSADIIALQEVETDQFYKFFLPELKRDGYEGIFSPKSRAKTMSEVDRKHVDGCAIFYRTTKFTLIKEHLVEFNQLAIEHANGHEDMLNRVMTKDNIALAALLHTKEACWENGVPPDHKDVAQPILVCSAHIHWDPEFCDVKLIQTMMLMEQLRQIVDSVSSGPSLRPGGKKGGSGAAQDNVQLLLCADFNSLPGSGVIEFISEGRVRADHTDFKSIQYSCLLKMLQHRPDRQEFTHAFQLQSAYSSDLLPFTNYTYDFKGIIDYIFFPRSSMRTLGILGPISEEWLKESKIIGCPHPHIPSDHFSLVVELGLSLQGAGQPGSHQVSAPPPLHPPPSLLGGFGRRQQTGKPDFSL